LDKCFVLDSNGNVQEVNRGEEPAFSEIAFINPRIEDPNAFLWLNLQTFEFEIQDNLSAKNRNKADKTLFILQLNHRDLLLEDRKSSAKYYYHRLALLVKIRSANTVEDILNALTPYENEIDRQQPLQDIKNQLTESIKGDITTFKHPSVWHSIKTIESYATPQWKTLFDQIPEARNW
jgi:hypothetical protein